MGGSRSEVMGGSLSRSLNLLAIQGVVIRKILNTRLGEVVRVPQ
jgi:hypothetical protein